MLFCGTIGSMKWNHQWEVSVCITMQEMMIFDWDREETPRSHSPIHVRVQK